MPNIIEQHLNSIGFSLPKIIKTAGTYTPYILENNFLYISGQLPIKNNKVIYTGKINNKNKKYGYKASELCALNILALVNIAIKGNIKKIKKCIRLNGFVNTDNNFSDIPFVINGASNIIKNIFKQNGVHTRTAIGVYNLPLNASVEIDAIFLTK